MKTFFGLATVMSIFILFTFGFQLAGEDIATNGKSNLDNDSILYIANYAGLREANLNIDTLSNNTDSFTQRDNATGEPTVDFAQEFLFYKQRAEQGISYLTTINKIPEFVIGAFGMEYSYWEPYLPIIYSFISILLIVAIYLFIKGRATED